jgi:hypothetical protein
MPKPISFKERARRRREAQAPQPSIPGFEKVLPFATWCKLKGFSTNTGKRLIRDGKVKTVRLSPGRIGISESADREFMAACENAAEATP